MWVLLFLLIQKEWMCCFQFKIAVCEQEFASSTFRNPIEMIIEGMKLYLPKNQKGNVQWVRKGHEYWGRNEDGVSDLI